MLRGTGIYLISDEVYEHIIYDGRRHKQRRNVVVVDHLQCRGRLTRMAEVGCRQVAVAHRKGNKNIAAGALWVDAAGVYRMPSSINP